MDDKEKIVHTMIDFIHSGPVTDIAKDINALKKKVRGLETQTSGGVYVIKAVDEIVNNLDVLQDDDELLFAADIGEYTWEIMFTWSSPTNAPGINFGITPPGGSSGWISTQLFSANGGTAWMKGYIICTALGTFNFQWSQGTATVEDTRVLAGSYIFYTKIA